MAEQKTHYVGQLQHPGGRPENVELIVNRRYPDRLVNTITDADATPSVKSTENHQIFKTANTGATTITDLDDGFISQTVHIIIGDANTTVDFTSSGLKGHGGVDWSPAADDSMTCIYDGTDWFCAIHEVQLNGLPVQLAQGTQTLAVADMNTIMEFTATATLTLPLNATTALPIGVPVVLNMKHATQVLTVTADTSVTLVSVFHPAGGSAASDTVKAGGTALLYKTAADVWVIGGDIST